MGAPYAMRAAMEKGFPSLADKDGQRTMSQLATVAMTAVTTVYALRLLRALRRRLSQNPLLRFLGLSPALSGTGAVVASEGMQDARRTDIFDLGADLLRRRVHSMVPLSDLILTSQSVSPESFTRVAGPALQSIHDYITANDIVRQQIRQRMTASDKAPPIAAAFQSGPHTVSTPIVEEV